MTHSPYPNQPAYPGGPGPSDGGKPRLRGRTPLRLAIVFFVVAVALFVVGGVVLAKKSLGKVDDFQRVSISSGSGSVRLDGTGKWIGYYEADNVDNGIDRIPNFRVAITDPSGQPVTFKPYGNRKDGKVDKLTYGIDGHHGAAALQFTAKAKGVYRVRLQAEDTLPSGAQLAFGRDIAKGTVAGALLIVGGVLFLIAAIVLLIVGLVKRNRHRGQLAVAGGYGGYGGPPPAYGPPGGYGPGGPPQGYGQAGPQPGYGQGAPQPGYGQGAPQPGYGQGAPQPGYGQGSPPPEAPPQGWGPPAGSGPSLSKE